VSCWECSNILRARGRRLDGRAFRVAIEAPERGERRIHQVIELEDIAMATSGDYRSWRDVEGRRISHTIDPRTRRPIEHGLASVTVLHERAMLADAWATALNVLGPEAGMQLADRLDLPATFIVRRADGGFETRPSRAFVARYGASDAQPAAASKRADPPEPR